jgi:hypothetical protein
MWSYITGRHQAVLINGFTSALVPLLFGVAQGSVLGPIVLILYSTPLYQLVRAFGVDSHFFSDDSQLYKIFCTFRRLLLVGVSQQVVCSTLANCFAAIQQWTIVNKMMLNVGKKDLLTVLDVKAAVPDSVIELCGESITSSQFFRNLGATFDANLNMEKHVSDICRRAFYHIHRIGLIRKYLDQSETARIISAFVLSLLDNGNSLLLGLPGNQLDRLQSVQNSAVRLINRTSRMEHITPQLAALHWLPIRYRIDFKIATLAFRCVHGTAPAYLMELVSLHTATRIGLRSEEDTLKLVVPPAKKVRWVECSFSSSAPRI